MKRIAVKLSVFISIILCFTLTVFAEALSPAEARKEAMGATVTVTGYAFSSTDTTSVGFVNEFYLSDARAAGICVVPSGSVSVSLYKEYSVTGTLSRVNGEIKLTNASVTPLPGTLSRKYYRLTYEKALDYENYGGTFARLIGTAASPVIENNVLKSFLLTNGESTIKVIIPDNVLSLSKGASGKAELTELLRYKRTVTVDGFVAKIGTETVIRIKDCDDIDVQEHTCVFGEAVTEKAPSCGIAGLSVKVCDCGKRLETVLPALEHCFYEVKEKTPTCTENGLSVKLCKNCSFRAETVISKTGHNYKERTEREPSCSLEGIRVRYCSDCDFREETPIARTNHSYKERVEKEATCTTDGVKVKYCSKCDFVAERFTIPKTGHNYKERTEREPSCSLEGIRVRYCSGCDFREETPIAKTNHTYKERVEKEATCTTDGVKVKYCSKCDFVAERFTIPKTGHNYKERTEREPSCSLEGIRVRYCSGCDFREETPIAKTNHSYKERVEKEATCTTDGVKVKYCSKCDLVAERLTIPKTGHNYKERTEREPSCSLEGIRVRYCSGCDFREETPIARTSHTYKERVEKEATCTADGVKVKYCSKCDLVAERLTIPKTGHNYKERTEREPSCSLEGIRVRYCSDCDFREETPIAKTNHTYKERVEKEATCTTDGVKVKYCSKCDFVAERFSIPKTGHSIKEKVEQESTCTTEGKAVKYCQNCDFREESVIPKKEHTVKTKTEVSATCTAEGKAVKYCQNCDFKEESVLPKTGHNYVDKLKKATFTDDGYIYKECKNCKNITEKTVISAVTVCSLSKESFVYDGKKHSVAVTLKDRNGKKITDFNCFGNEGKDIGKYAVTVELKGNYSGKKSLSFSVVPGNPTDLKAVVIANQVTLTFKGTAGADGYRVYYQKGTKLESLGTTTKTSCSFALPDYGKSYTLVIKSYKKSGDTTLWSSGVKTTISSGPHNVTGIKGNSNYYKIKLSWDKAETADGYRVYIKFDGKYKVLTTTEKTSFTVSPLKSDTKYTFAVKAYRKVNGKTLWGKATKKTVTTLSGKPASFSAKESYYTVDLSWREVKGAEGYKVYVYNAKKKKYVTLKSVTSSKCTAENLNSGTTYKFAVKPYAKDGKKIRYGEAVYLTVTTRLKTPSLSVTAKSKSNTLSWKKVNGASGYEIYYCYEKNGKYKKLKTTDKLSFNHTGVSKVCYYKVRAYKVVGKEKLYSSFSTVKKAAR